MRTWLGTAAPFALVAVAAGLVWWFMSARIDNADRAKDEALAIAERATAHAASLDSAAQAFADSAAHWRSVADTARRVVTRWRTVIDTQYVPAEAQPYTAPRDSAIAALEIEVAALREAERQASDAASAYRFRGDIAVAALDSMRAVVASIRTPSRLVFGPGATHGYSTRGERVTALGLSATVSIYPSDIARVIRWVF